MKRKQINGASLLLNKSTEERVAASSSSISSDERTSTDLLVGQKFNILGFSSFE